LKSFNNFILILIPNISFSMTTILIRLIPYTQKQNSFYLKKVINKQIEIFFKEKKLF
jgi:hypothetical protein